MKIKGENQNGNLSLKKVTKVNQTGFVGVKEFNLEIADKDSTSSRTVWMGKSTTLRMNASGEIPSGKLKIGDKSKLT